MNHPIRAWVDRYLDTHPEARSVRLGYHGPEVWTDVTLRDGAHVSATAPDALPEVPDAVERAVQASFLPGDFQDYPRSPDRTVKGGSKGSPDPHVLRPGHSTTCTRGGRFVGFRTFLAITAPRTSSP